MNRNVFDKLAEEICSKYCKYPNLCKNQDQMDEICSTCPLITMERMISFHDAKQRAKKNVGKDKQILRQ